MALTRRSFFAALAAAPVAVVVVKAQTPESLAEQYRRSTLQYRIKDRPRLSTDEISLHIDHLIDEMRKSREQIYSLAGTSHG